MVVGPSYMWPTVFGCFEERLPRGACVRECGFGGGGVHGDRETRRKTGTRRVEAWETRQSERERERNETSSSERCVQACCSRFGDFITGAIIKPEHGDERRAQTLSAERRSTRRSLVLRGVSTGILRRVDRRFPPGRAAWTVTARTATPIPNSSSARGPHSFCDVSSLSRRKKRHLVGPLARCTHKAVVIVMIALLTTLKKLTYSHVG